MEITRDMGIVTKLVKGNDLSRSTRFHDEKKPIYWMEAVTLYALCSCDISLA